MLHFIHRFEYLQIYIFPTVLYVVIRIMNVVIRIMNIVIRIMNIVGWELWESYLKSCS